MPTTRGNEWARANLPQAARFNTEILTLPAVPVKQAGAPAQLSVHAGGEGVIRLSLDWTPDAGMIGWWVVPWVGGVEFPGRALTPLRDFDWIYVNFNNAANPASFYGCAVAARWNEQRRYREFFFRRFNANVGLPAQSQIRLYPAIASR